MDCLRAEELLSDHLEGLLDAPLAGDLEQHLRGCAGCRELRAALQEVVAALRSAPELEPAQDLADRAATAALDDARRHWADARKRVVLPPLPGPLRRLGNVQGMAAVRGLAAALALAATAVVFGAQSLVGQSPSRLVGRASRAGAYVLEKKDRVMEDFRALRVVIATAFEGRLDRMNDRVDDYRRLLERRRVSQPAGQAPPLPSRPSVLREEGDATAGRFPNTGALAIVQVAVTSGGDAPPSPGKSPRSNA